MKFSIVIPNYNGYNYTEKLLKSILNQTYTNYEIIFVDDMSSDESVKVAKKLLKKPHKIIENKSKRLSGGSRNVGICEATGDYIICIDCDDWLSDNKVLEDINNKLNNEDIMFLGFKMLLKDGLSTDNILDIHDKESALKCGFGANWLKVVKRELYLEHLLPEGTLYEDRINHLELCIYANTFTSLGRTTHIWNRINEKATTFSPVWGRYKFEYCGELYRLIQEVEDKYKSFLINELKTYINKCNEMVNGL